MIKLTNILTELLNTFEITALLSSDRKVPITEILDQIRALRKITTVRNMTPPEYMVQSSSEHTIVSIKFVTRGEANDMLQGFLDDALATSPGPDEDNIRIQGIKSMKYREDTLKRL